MNAFNRVFTIVAAIALMVLGVLALGLPWVLIGLVEGLGTTIKTLSGNTADTAPVAEIAVRVLFVLVWLGLFGGLLWMELRKTNAASIQVMRTAGGSKVQVTTKAVQDRVRQKIDAISQVMDVTVTVVAKKKALEAIQIYSVVAHDTDLVSKGKEIETAVREVVQEELGLNLMTEPTVTLKAAPPPRSFFPQLNIFNRGKQEEAPQAQLPSAPKPTPYTPPDDAIDADARSVDSVGSDPIHSPSPEPEAERTKS
jgi:hypothetical protein